MVTLYEYYYTLTGKKSQHQEKDKRNLVDVFIHLKDDIDSNFALKCGASSATQNLHIRVALTACWQVQRLGRNVSTVHDCYEQGSSNGSALRRPGFVGIRGTTERKDRCIRSKTVAHCTAPVAEIRSAISTTMTQRTIGNRSLQGQLRVRCSVVCIPLTPGHCCLRRQRCQTGAH
ncbi:HTH_Tnp_Tc3_2 domain-containing protein [Trichonephila clavipes]|nr:HTH_Tnp_Tc3_2 domain-containing protein [Trichonephila clavipes]